MVLRASRGDAQQIVFSFTHYSPLAPSYPHYSSDIRLSLSPVHGTARLAFILRLVHSITRGTLLTTLTSSRQANDTASTDYSSGARLNLSFSSISIHLPCDENFRSSYEVRADCLSLVTGDRSMLFNTLVLHATPLQLLDRREAKKSAVVVATPEAELKIHISAALTRLSLSLGHASVVLQPNTIERVLQAVQHLLANREKDEPADPAESEQPEELEEELLTEVSDSESEDSVEKTALRANFCFEVSLASLRCNVTPPCFSSALDIDTYLIEANNGSSLALCAEKPFFSIKSSIRDRTFGRFRTDCSPLRVPHAPLFARKLHPRCLLPLGR